MTKLRSFVLLQCEGPLKLMGGNVRLQISLPFVLTNVSYTAVCTVYSINEICHIFCANVFCRLACSSICPPPVNRKRCGSGATFDIKYGFCSTKN